MITPKQIEVLSSIEPVLRQAKALVDCLHLPALVSGVDHVTGGLATALAGLEQLLRHRRKPE